MSESSSVLADQTAPVSSIAAVGNELFELEHCLTEDVNKVVIGMLDFIAIGRFSLTCKHWKENAWKSLKSLNLYPQSLAIELRYLPLVSAIDLSFFSDPNTTTVYTANLDAEPVVFTLAPFALAKKRRALFLKWLLKSLEAGNVFNSSLKSLSLLDRQPPNSGGLVLSARSVAAWECLCAESDRKLEERVVKSMKQFTALETLRLRPGVPDQALLPDVRRLQNMMLHLTNNNISDFTDFKSLKRLRIVPRISQGPVSVFASPEACDTILDQVTQKCSLLEYLSVPVAQNSWLEKVRQLPKLRKLVVCLHPSYDGGPLITETAKKIDYEALVSEVLAQLPNVGINFVWTGGGKAGQIDLLSTVMKRGADAVRAFLKAAGNKLDAQHRIGTLRAFIFNSDDTKFTPNVDMMDVLVEIDPFTTLSQSVPSFLPAQYAKFDSVSKAGYLIINAPAPYFWVVGANILQGIAALEGAEYLLRLWLHKYVKPLEPQQQRELLISSTNGMTLPMFAFNAVANLAVVTDFLINEINGKDILSCIDFSGQNILHYIARFDAFGSRGFHDQLGSMERCSAVVNQILEVGVSCDVQRFEDGKTPLEIACGDFGIFLHRGQVGRVVPTQLSAKTNPATVKRLFFSEISKIKKVVALAASSTVSLPLDCRDINLPLLHVPTYNSRRALRSASIVRHANLTPQEATEALHTSFDEIVQNMDGFNMLEALLACGADATINLPSGVHPLERAAQCAVSSNYMHVLADINRKKGIQLHTFKESASTQGTLAHACIRSYVQRSEEASDGAKAAIVKMLLLSGVDMNAKDTHDRTITDLAEMMRATDTLDVIKRFDLEYGGRYAATNAAGTPQRERVKVRVRRSPKPATPAAESNAGQDDLSKLFESVSLDDKM